MSINVCCRTRKDDQRCVGSRGYGYYCSIPINDISEVATKLQTFDNRYGGNCQIPTEEIIKTMEVFIGWDAANKKVLSRPLTEEEWAELDIMCW